MSSIIDTLFIQTLRAEIEVSRLNLSKLTEQINAASSDDERKRLAALFGETRRQFESMELQLASLLKQNE